jgi:signal peptidase I
VTDRLRGWAHTAATTWLLFVGALAAWSVVPIALGWHPVVVVSGSMEPHVHPGDVVLVDGHLRVPGPGQVVLVRDPGTSTGSKLHRVVRFDAQGRLVTKGDANPTEDTTPVEPSDVEGVARVLVPGAGRLSMLTRRQERSDWAWAGGTLLSAAVLSLVPSTGGGRRRRRVGRATQGVSVTPTPVQSPQRT